MVSQDGHPVGGSLVFSIGVVTASAAKSNGGPVAVLIWLARIGVYVGLFAGVGGVFFAAWIGQGGARVITGALAVGVASAVASLGLQGLDLLDLSARRAGDISAMDQRARNQPRTVAADCDRVDGHRRVRVAQPDRDDRQGVDCSRDGRRRAVAGNERARRNGVTEMADGAGDVRPWRCHRLLGRRTRAPCWRWRDNRRRAVVPVLQRFSRLAVPVVGRLVLSGLGLAIVQLESFGALIETRYGIILLVKLMLVTVLLGLAALNRYRLTPAVAADPQNTRPLIGSILIECVVVVGILAVVAGWRFTPPPRALAAAAQGAAGDPYPHREGDGSGLDFAGQSGIGRFRRCNC